MEVLPIVSAVVGVLFIGALALLQSFLYVCRPNEVLIFAGRSHQRADGGEVGYRVVFGGRAWRVPLIESVERMDMRIGFLQGPATLVEPVVGEFLLRSGHFPVQGFDAAVDL